MMKPLAASPWPLALRSAIGVTFGLCCSAAAVRADDHCAQLGKLCWAAVDEALLDAAKSESIPGAVLLVGEGDQVLVRKAYGQRSLKPNRTPMTVDTVFDLASVSKVVGTATSVMVLIDQGKLKPTDKVSKFLPEFAANGKGDVTVEQLLLHRAGLIPDNPLKDYQDGPSAAMTKVCALKPIYPPGTKFDYSDVGYYVLGEIVRIVSGKPLNEFAKENVFAPLGMKETGYLPAEALRTRCAPTEEREGHWMIGEVHDPRAYLLGGFAGHAGLFATADDIARYCRMILNGGELDGKRILSAATIAEMTKSRCLPDGTGCRGYGWDIGTGYSAPRGRLFARNTSIGHTGYTGTSLWLDLPSRTYVILLTNYVHPRDAHRPISWLRREVGTLVAAALMAEGRVPVPAVVEAKPSADAGDLSDDSVPAGATVDATQADESSRGADAPDARPAAVVGSARTAIPGLRNGRGAPAQVLCGVDVLERDKFSILSGRKVAIITNHTGLTRDGRRTVDVIAKAPGVKVLKLFSPEHGLYGTLDEKVGNTTDKATGLEVYSLYGETRRPSDKMLEGIDTLVYDIQDIGARFYTYPATMGNCMEEAAKRKMRVVVLDRPNPITGLIVDGPLADAKKLGFTAYLPMPVSHGMTIGELAKMFNVERKINCDLTVVPIEGWTRAMWWDETGLTWVNPSPNMRNLNQALLYLPIGLLEASNISVGRGTDQPFELLGAPWIDGPRLSAALNAAALPGLRFYPMDFTPDTREFKGKVCHGVFIVMTDRTAVDPTRTGLTIAWTLRKLFGDQYQIDKVNNLLASASTLAALKSAEDPQKLPALWKDDVARFRTLREKYLMYR